MTPLRLLLARGAIASPYRWHVDSFLAQHFPRGTAFAAQSPAPDHAGDLPLATVRAFSIDDSATTEIDDAFSVQTLGDRTRIGIHIAAPAVVLPRGHSIDTVARCAHVDRVCAGAEVHDAARRLDRILVAERRSGSSGAIAVRRRRRTNISKWYRPSRGWSGCAYRAICGTTGSMRSSRKQRSPTANSIRHMQRS